ncbi:serine/threonine kinase [Aureococcus anophagefferens]|nr:serine/threonine kinase [Aureococcus anophagefferens]
MMGSERAAAPRIGLLFAAACAASPPRFAIATTMAGRRCDFDRVARTRMWLASLRRTDTNATVVLLASGFDGGELARAFRSPAFDRVVAVAPSELRFRARREGDGLLPPARARRGRDSAIQPRDDGAGTTLKFWAWALADFDGVVVADADGFMAELHRRRAPFAAAAERGNRDYDGFNSHLFYARPSLDVFALLRDKAASGDFVPYTNTEQDVFDTGRCAGNDEPSSPTHAATGEFAECYASRYPDLHDAFCRHPSGCDISALGHHYRDRGASGGRIFRCGGCDACNYTVSDEGRTEWAACGR